MLYDLDLRKLGMHSSEDPQTRALEEESRQWKDTGSLAKGLLTPPTPLPCLQLSQLF